jgi:hypothetical protein
MDNCDDALWFAAQVETSGEPITAAAVVKALGRREQRAELDAETAEANIAREAEIASAIPGALETLVDEGMLGKETRLLPAGGRADRPVPPPMEEEVRYRITGLGLQKLASMELE